MSIHYYRVYLVPNSSHCKISSFTLYNSLKTVSPVLSNQKANTVFNCSLTITLICWHCYKLICWLVNNKPLCG